jgi:hypothetical protein
MAIYKARNSLLCATFGFFRVCHRPHEVSSIARAAAVVDRVTRTGSRHLYSTTSSPPKLCITVR